MKILVVGGGGREHALVWKIAQSPLVEKIYCAPGNPGIAELAECVDIPVDRIAALCDFALDQADRPDRGRSRGAADPRHRRPVPDRRAGDFRPEQGRGPARGEQVLLQGSDGQVRHPHRRLPLFHRARQAAAYIREQGAPIVVKADGLAAGKGSSLPRASSRRWPAVDEIMLDQVFGSAGASVVIEEFMAGEEASFFAFTDGTNILPLASAQDHKRIFDNDQGPNTGGMGAYSPAPVVTPALHAEIVDTIVKPTIAGMAAEGCPYCGILYVGLMIEHGKPRVVEFNARFGDPEAQPLLVRMNSDLVPVLLACARGD